MLNLNLFNQKSGVDFFQGGSVLSAHITTFMVNFVWKKEMNVKYGDEKAKLTSLVNVYESLEDGDHLKTALKDDYDKAVKRLTEIEEEIKTIMTDYNFVATDADKALKKLLYNRDGKTTMAQIKRALVTWYQSYGIECNEKTYVITATLESMGLKFNMNKFIESKAECGLTFDGATAYQNVWHVAYTYGVKAGSIKKTNIPPMLQDKYDTLKAMQDAKKAEKDTEKAAKTKSKAQTKKNDRKNKRTNIGGITKADKSKKVA